MHRFTLASLITLSLPLPTLVQEVPKPIDFKQAQQSEPSRQDVDFGPYMAALKKRIHRNWVYAEPGSQSMRRVVLNFKIAPDGSLSELRIKRSSGSDTADQIALHAVERSVPFDPLPTSYEGNGIDISFTFDANVFGGDMSSF